jgi:hypothetical protein
LADRYEAFSPWLAAFLRKAGERPPADADAPREGRVTLRIIRRRTGRDSRDHNESEDAEEEMFRTVAPLSATVDELKQRLWQEQVRLLDSPSSSSSAGGGDQPWGGGDEGQLLRPSDMSVLYRVRKGAEVHLHGSDALQDYLLPRQHSGAQDYEMVIGHEPRLLAFAQFPDLAESLARLKGMVDAEERDQWDAAAVTAPPHGGGGGRGTLYDYLCHHFEYLEEQNEQLLRRARKERKRRRERGALRDERQKKDAENGYRDAPGRTTPAHTHKEKRIEAGEPVHAEEDPSPAAHIVRFYAASSSSAAVAAAAVDTDILSTSKERVERCAIHLGSLTKEDEEPLYAVFRANPEWPFHAHQRWLFHAWSDEFSLVDKYGLSTSSSPPSSSSSSPSPSSSASSSPLMLPAAPRYFGRVEDLYLVPGVRIYLNAEHLLRARPDRRRFDQCAYPSKDELAFVTDSSR